MWYVVLALMVFVLLVVVYWKIDKVMTITRLSLRFNDWPLRPPCSAGSCPDYEQLRRAFEKYSDAGCPCTETERTVMLNNTLKTREYLEDKVCSSCPRRALANAEDMHAELLRVLREDEKLLVEFPEAVACIRRCHKHLERQWADEKIVLAGNASERESALSRLGEMYLDKTGSQKEDP